MGVALAIILYYDIAAREERQTLHREISAVVEPNGLVLNEDTLNDGNCQLDAVLRGICLTPPQQRTPEMNRIVHLLDTKGRFYAVQEMRKLAIQYIIDHRNGNKTNKTKTTITHNIKKLKQQQQQQQKLTSTTGMMKFYQLYPSSRISKWMVYLSLHTWCRFHTQQNATQRKHAQTRTNANTNTNKNKQTNTNNTLSNYSNKLAMMRKPFEWCDHHILYALSGHFGVNVIVFSGTIEPWLVAAVESHAAPLISIANAHNYHFWALHQGDAPPPSQDDADIALDSGDLILTKLVTHDPAATHEFVGDPSCGNLTAMIESRRNITAAKIASDQTQLVALTRSLITWTPFSSEHVNQSLQAAYKVIAKSHNTNSGTDWIFDILRWRQAA